jgi:2-polyprenyl-6-methoxyphenol hydroxylase-like FAD-dependent oxidoreductase
MRRVERVLIVGGGIGGLCLAVALRDRGIVVDILEIKRDWKVYGVGIIQQSNVVRAMAQLGLVDEYLAASFPFENVAIHAPDGHLLATLPGRRLAGPNYPANLGIARPALHDVLTRAAADRGASVRLGCTVDAIEQNADAVTVTLSDGEQETYDLVVGADGVHSKVRSLVFPEAPAPRFTGQGVWRYNFARLPEVDHLLSFVGPGGAGLVPIADDLMYMFVVCTEPANQRPVKDQIHILMQARASAYGGMIGRIRSQITDPAKVVYRPVEIVMVPDPWFKGRVVLIGDAAHTTSPHLGQGAGMAVEDAIVLGQELNAPGSLDESLARFMRRRYGRCRFIVEKSELVGTWQMNHSPEANIPALVNEMIEVTARPI